MSERADTSIPTGQADPAPALVPVEGVLSGQNARGEPAGCPTGLTNPPELQQPGPDAVHGDEPGKITSPGEGVPNDKTPA